MILLDDYDLCTHSVGITDLYSSKIPLSRPDFEASCGLHTVVLSQVVLAYFRIGWPFGFFIYFYKRIKITSNFASISI